MVQVHVTPRGDRRARGAVPGGRPPELPVPGFARRTLSTPYVGGSPGEVDRLAKLPYTRGGRIAPADLAANVIEVEGSSL